MDGDGTPCCRQALHAVSDVRLLENESRHIEALGVWQKVLIGKQIAIMPYSILIEVVAAIRRRTGSEKLAMEIKNEFMNIDYLSFVVLDIEAAAS